jgi:hypothetical protein
MDAFDTLRHAKYDALIARCEGLPPVPTAVVHPCDASSLQGAIEAGAAGIIRPLLVGPTAKIRRVAEQAGIDISGLAPSMPRTATPPPARPSKWSAPARPPPS